MGFFAEMLLHCLCVLYLFFLLAACHCRCICFYSFLFISFKEIQMNTIRMSLKNQTYVHFVVALLLLLHTPITNHSLTLVCNRNVYGSPYDGIFFWRKSLHCINILILIFNDAYTITPHHHLHFRVFV